MRRARRESLMNCLLHEEASLNSHHGKPAAKKRKAQVVHLITPNRLKQGRVLTIVHQGPVSHAESRRSSVTTQHQRVQSAKLVASSINVSITQIQ